MAIDHYSRFYLASKSRFATSAVSYYRNPGITRVSGFFGFQISGKKKAFAFALLYRENFGDIERQKPIPRRNGKYYQ